MLRQLRKLSPILLLVGIVAHAQILNDLTPKSLHDVLKVARAIYVVQPYLPENKYLEYGLDIFRAAKRYHVEPSVLISITQQESGFREMLPEGAAGERGICQILKSWLTNSRFRREFPSATLKDFDRPNRSFLFAAWILGQLKKDTVGQTLPYWSFYNSNHFPSRRRYFSLVNRYVSQIKKYRTYILSNQQPDEGFSPVAVEDAPKPQVVAVATTATGYWKAAKPEFESDSNANDEVESENTETRPAVASAPQPQEVRPAYAQPQSRLVASVSRAVPAVAVQPVAQAVPQVSVQSLGPTPSEPVAVPTGNWITDAFKRLHQETVAKQVEANPRSQEPAAISSPSIVRAAAELDIPGVFFDQTR